MATAASLDVSIAAPASSGMAAADTGVIDAVVFDLGGVLVDWNPRYLYRQIFQAETEMEDFLARVCPPAWNEQQDRGRPWAEAVRLLQALGCCKCMTRSREMPHCQ